MVINSNNLQFKHLLVILLVSFNFLSSSCFSRQLTQEDRIYYKNLKNCVPMVGQVFNIHGYVNGKCRVSMALMVNQADENSKAILTYEYPKNELNDMVNDAIHMPELDFKNKWAPKEEQYCTSIKLNGEEIFAR